MLSDRHIVEAINRGHIVVDPFEPRGGDGEARLLQPASLDVRLGGQFRVNIARDQWPEWTGDLKLYPGQFALGHTFERIKLGDHYAARVDGKSTLGRQGLSVHITAGFIDPGFEGQVTLELFNLSQQVIVLRPGMAIAQLEFHRLSGPSHHPYGSPGLGSRYQGQSGAVAAR